MSRPLCLAAVFLTLQLPAMPAVSLATSPPDEGAIISEATGGAMIAATGKLADDGCGTPADYEAQVVDLNGDGQPEVFTSIFGSCLGGAAGVAVDLLIKVNGKWTPQFGFPGIHRVLETGNKGYPDIEIGGPGFCFPIWRWNGRQYDLDRFEYEGKRCTPP